MAGFLSFDAVVIVSNIFQMASDVYFLAKKWFVAVFAALLLAVFLTPMSYSADYFFMVWVLAGFSALYRARTVENKKLSKHLRSALVLLGLASCALSFISIPLGLGKPPYSLDDFTLLLGGASLVYFAFRDYSALVLSAAIPVVVVLGFQVLGGSPAEWSEPMVEPTVTVTSLIVRAIGLNPDVRGNVISYAARDGGKMKFSIVADCTGVWSLIAYTVAVGTVIVVFPRIRRKGYALIAAGFAGTYLMNLLRVTLIFLAGYWFDEEAATQMAHTHIGWIVFSLWMFVFWYTFFSMHVVKKPAVSSS